MKYIDDIGLVYDILYYNVIYFNENEFRKKYSKYTETPEDDFAFYKSTGKKIKKPADYMKALFYTENDRDCFLLKYVMNYLQSNKKFDDFINVFCDNKRFLDDFLEYYFDEILDIEDVEKVYSGINKLNLSADMMNSISVILSNADIVLNDIIELFLNQKDRISYKRSLKSVQNEIKSVMRSPEFMDIIIKILSVREKDIENSYFSISYMYPYFYLVKIHNDDWYFSLSEKFFDNIKCDFVYDNVSIESYSGVRNNPVRNMIINLLADEDMTIVQIQKILGSVNRDISMDMTLKAMQILTKEKVVKRYKKDGKQYCYTLNLEYFKVIYSLEDEQRNRIMKGGQRDEVKEDLDTT